jgi:hypothetical protein
VSSATGHCEVCDFEYFGVFLDDPRLPFARSPEGSYGIARVASTSAEGWWEVPDLIAVSYCPWCGQRL